MSHDLVLAGGRVVDPETGFDRVRDVGIDGDSVTAVGDGLDGATTVDVGGLVVAPGFVDLHSHAQTLPGRRLQACDGVTTALDLEAGRAPVELAYAREAERGSPINYGFSASWAAARMHVIADGPLDGGAAADLRRVGGHRVATGRDRGASGADRRPGLDRPRRRRRRYRRADRLHTRSRSGRVSRHRGTGGGRRRADVHALARHRRVDSGHGDRRRRRTRPGRGHDRRPHALLPHQLDVGTAHRSSARAGRPLSGRRRPRHDRGLSLRVGIDGDRRHVPRAGAGA